METYCLILVGAGGSGKETQANRLPFCQISTGNMFKEHINLRTPLGIEAEKFTAAGELVPDRITIEMLTLRLKEVSGHFLLDGFPRNAAQVAVLKKFLKDNGIKLGGVFYLKVSEEELKRRITGRRVCTGSVVHTTHVSQLQNGQTNCPDCGAELKTRPDDTPEVAAKRFLVFWEQTAPILALFGEDLIEIDGDPTPEEVHAQIAAELTKRIPMWETLAA